MTNASTGKPSTGNSSGRVKSSTHSWGKGSVLGTGQTYTGKSTSADGDSALRQAIVRASRSK